VVGVDRDPPPGTNENVDRLVVADLDAGLPPEVAAETPFDVVLALDVLEHLREPSRLLRELHAVCSPDTVLVTSVPNIGHWYPRLRIGLGRFDYDRRGILDATHLRFFTWRSFAAMAARVGWRAEQRRVTGLPLEVLGLDGGASPGRRALARVDRAGRRAWPSLFAYQYVAVMRPDPAFASLAELPTRDAGAATRT
jgi:SAM-dependent methyltransferase